MIRQNDGWPAVEACGFRASWMFDVGARSNVANAILKSVISEVVFGDGKSRKSDSPDAVPDPCLISHMSD